MAARSAGIEYADKHMWADQIQFLLEHDPRLFDFHAAYGHPGTTLLELGSLFHLFFRCSYTVALDLTISILIAASTAACSVFCFLLYRGSLWWLATASVLLLNRMYVNATPPTAVVMPFIVLIALACWWLWQQRVIAQKGIAFPLFGAVIGAAAATRLDATLLLSAPIFLLLLSRYGVKSAMLLLLGAGISFFVANPFLWFMPRQHIADLVLKFFVHYNTSTPRGITNVPIWVNFLWLSVISLSWALVLLSRRCLERIIPKPIFLMVMGTSLFALTGILSSKFLAIRYLFPLIAIWEVFLPLFALETLASNNPAHASKVFAPYATKISWWTVALTALAQLVAYLRF